MTLVELYSRISTINLLINLNILGINTVMAELDNLNH